MKRGEVMMGLTPLYPLSLKEGTVEEQVIINDDCTIEEDKGVS